MSEHAKLSPSGAHRWMVCPGSLFLESGYPDSNSEFAAEGTLAHALAAQCLEEEIDPGYFVDQTEPYCYWDHGVMRKATITKDMAREVQKYLDNVRADIEDGDELMVEQKLPFFVANDLGVPEQFGTSDTVLIKVAKRALRIRDLKYGRGVQVFAEENEQLMLYALAALDEFGLLYDIDTVEMVVDQPRLNHVDEWACTVDYLRDFERRALRAGQLALSIKDLSGGQVFLQPGQKQCGFCKAKGDCPALRDKVLATVMGDFEVITEGGDPQAPNTVTGALITLGKGEIAVTITEAEKIIAAAHGVAPKAVDFEPSHANDQQESFFIVKKPTIRPALDGAEERIAALTPDHLAVCMDSVDLVEGWCKAVRAEAERRMLAGTPVPGWKLVTGKAGSRAWNDLEAAKARLKSMRLRDDVMYDFTLISPTTAEKLHAEGVIKPKQWAALQDFITRSNGKPSVAPAADKRPALDIGKAEDDFSALDDDSCDLL